MPRRNPLDQIRKIVDEQTVKPGAVVDNLHNSIPEGQIIETVVKEKGWFILTAETSALPTLDEFVDQFSSEQPGFLEQNADSDGEVSFVGTSGEAILYLTTIKNLGPLSLPIQVEAVGYEISVYVDLARVGTGGEGLTVTQQLGPGTHSIAVLLHGGSGRTSVTLPAHVETFRIEPVPPPPRWLRDPEVLYLNPQQGTVINRLTWLNDSLASGWQVYRAPADVIAEIIDTTDNGDGTFTVRCQRFDGAAFTAPNRSDFYTKHFFGGVVQSSVAGADVDGDFYLDIIVIVSGEADPTPANWLEEQYVRPGKFDSVAKLTYTNTDTITWDDPNVEIDRVYIYALTAFGFLRGVTESEFSTIGWILSNDETPPGPATVIADFVDKKQVTLFFTAPADEDYAGVYVYGPYDTGTTPLTLDPADRVTLEYGEPGQLDQLTFNAADTAKDYFVVSFDSIGNRQTIANATRYSFGGPKYTAGRDPELTIELLEAPPNSGSDWFYAFKVHVRLTATNPIDTEGITLQWKRTGESYSTTERIATGTGTVTTEVIFSRSWDLVTERYLSVKATSDDTGLSVEKTFLVDWDHNPKISHVNINPRGTATEQEGWTAVGSTDDDTHSVLITLTGDISFTDAGFTSPQRINLDNVDGNTTAGFSVDLTQSAGKSGKITIVPNSKGDGSGKNGPKFEQTVRRAPVSWVTFNEKNQQRLNAFIRGRPSNCILYYRVYPEDSTPGAFSNTSGATPTDSVKVANIVRDPQDATILEFYAAVGDNVEEVNSVTLDPDKIPEIDNFTAKQVPGQATLKISGDPDDDSVLWKIWARNGEWPTINGGTGATPTGDPDPDFERFAGAVSNNTVLLTANPGTWFAVAHALDWSGANGPISFDSVIVVDPSGAAPEGAITDFTIEKDYVNDIYYLHYPHNDEIENSTGVYFVDISYSIDGAPYSTLITERDAKLDYQGTVASEGSFQHTLPFPFADTSGGGFTSGTYHTFRYKLELSSFDGTTFTPLDTLYTSTSDFFQG